MKNFLKQVLIILLVPVLGFCLINIIMYKAGNDSRMVAFEVYDAIDSTNQHTNYKAIVLGDSVARQFFNPLYQSENEDVCYLTTNQAVSAAGNYILLQNFLENNPQVKEVYYIVRPNSLTNNANFIYTYSYFITPLFNESFKKYLQADTIRAIEKTYGKVWTNNNFAKWLLAKYPKGLELYNRSSKFIWQQRNSLLNQNTLPDLTLPYLKKIAEVCEEKDITLYLLSVPLPKNYEYNYVELYDGMKKLGLTDLYEQMIRSVQYVGENEFVDEVHLKPEFVIKNRQSYVHNILRKYSINFG